MPVPSLSPALSSSQWLKIAGANDKGTGIGDAMKALEKAHLAIDNSVLEPAKLKTSDEVEDRIESLDGEMKKNIPAACDLAKKLSNLAKSKEPEFKKKPDTAKTVAPALAKINAEAAAYAADLEKAAAATRADLAKLLEKLQAEEKKNAGDDDKDAEKGDINFVNGRTMSAMKRVRNAKPEETDKRPFRFMVAYGTTTKSTLAFVAQISSIGGSHRTLLKKLMPDDSKCEFYKGTVVFENKAWTFICEGKSPTGAFGKILQKGLREQTKANYRVRLRKHTGEVEEVEGDIDVPEIAEGAEGKGATAGGGDTGATQGERRAGGDSADVDPVKGFMARLNALSPRITAAIKAGGRAGDEVRRRVAEATNLGKTAEGAVRAGAMLDEVEKILAAAGAADRAALDKLDKARADWVGVRTQFQRGVVQLATSLDEIYREEPDQRAAVTAAKKKLAEAASKVTADLERQLDAAVKEQDAARRAALIATAKKTLALIEKLVNDDPLIRELDGNELMPSLVIVKPMQARLREVAAALG